MINVKDAEISVFTANSANSNNLANHWAMNETRGTTGHDVQGSADLTLNGVTPNDATFDNLPAYTFESDSNEYASISSKSFDTSGGISEITVAAWVKSSSSSQQVIISFDEDEYWELQLNNGSNKAQWSTTDSSSTTDHLTSSSGYTDGNWHLVAGVFDADGTNEKRLVVDGTEDASNSPHSGNNLGTGTTRFGFIGAGSEASSADGSKSGNYFDGNMAVCFIYNRALSNQELTDIYNAGSVAIPPDFTVPASDILSMDISQRIDNRRDTGRIQIDNNAGTYDSGSNEILSGDLLRFRTKLQGETDFSHQWSAMSETTLYEQLDANQSDIRIEATDFVFGVISNRIIENSYEGESFQSILDDAMGNASEVHADRVQGISDTTDAYPRGSNLLDFLNEMAGKANAVVSNRDRSLVFEKAKQAPFAFTLSSSDKGTHIIRKEGSSIVNRARVDGGQDIAIDDQQTTQSATTTVTESSRITHQLSTRKATVDRIDLYTDPTQNQIDRGENLVIRLQKDDGGSPIAVSDSESDITSKEVDASELTQGGLTTFFFPDHVLPEPNPWMIIESSGSGGIDIGVDGSNNPRYDAYFQFRISSISGSKGSQDSYRQRDVRRFHGSLRSRDAAKDMASSIVSHNKEPDTFINFQAESKQAHNVKVGDIIDVSETNASGQFIITSKTSQYDGLKLQTEVEAQKVSTV